MVKPQQPELARSRLGSTDKDGKELRAGTGPTDTRDIGGPVPEENQPGHHPEVEQDKPDPGDRT